ncbi:DUF7556 family protein [Salinadaptatus halalkaliphilus]|uniref:DUF7556 family protein n=1 Tax=Salinadaptatus halalkaliphilus TaxID=2419781 RepID=UPI0015807C8D|nr:hypothetical protein [Salinadaptatus halalkaliphilus]
MTPNVGSVGRESADDRDVVTAVDEIDGRDHLVIADLTQDEAWLSAAECDATSLEEWQ